MTSGRGHAGSSPAVRTQDRRDAGAVQGQPEAFDEAVRQVTAATDQLLGSITVGAAPRRAG